MKTVLHQVGAVIIWQVIDFYIVQYCFTIFPTNFLKVETIVNICLNDSRITNHPAEYII